MDGIERARSQAVTSPLPSKINGLIGNFLMARMALSVNTTVTDARRIFIMTPRPKT